MNFIPKIDNIILEFVKKFYDDQDYMVFKLYYTTPQMSIDNIVKLLKVDADRISSIITEITSDLRYRLEIEIPDPEEEQIDSLEYDN